MYQLELVSYTQILEVPLGGLLNISIDSLRALVRDYQRYRSKCYYLKFKHLKKIKTEADEITCIKLQLEKTEALLKQKQIKW